MSPPHLKQGRWLVPMQGGTKSCSSPKRLQITMQIQPKCRGKGCVLHRPRARAIHFGEGLAETEQARQRLGSSCEQARQRLGSSCDLLGAYQYAKYLIHACRGSSTARLTAWKSHHMVAAASSSNRNEACRTALSWQSGLQIKLRTQRSTACFGRVGGGGRGNHVVGFPSCQARSREATGSVDQILRILVGAQQIARTSQPLAGLFSLCQTLPEVDCAPRGR